MHNRLPENVPLALIGDVHGEYDALEALLRRIDCHPEDGAPSRIVVFLGDLVDRGPDSPAVVRRVAEMMSKGHAYCVLGNHEMNIVRGHHKPGNQWFFGDAWRIDEMTTDSFGLDGVQHPFPSHWVESDAERDAIRVFFAGLPLSLERDDVRLVHACWHEMLSTAPAQWVPLADETSAQIKTRLRAQGLLSKERTNRYDRAHGKPSDPEFRRLVQVESAMQNENAVKVAVSGTEEAFSAPRWVGGKWRVLGRSPWWEAPSEDTRPVVIGHYWRQRTPGSGGPWGSIPPFAWAGGSRPVFCLDYSVGRRYQERALSEGPPERFSGALAAMLWPERTLVFDDDPAVLSTETENNAS